jgi:hypothetical protein
MSRNLVGVTLVGFAFISLILSQALPVHAASTLVEQNNGGCDSCSSTTLSVPFLANVASGDLVVAGIIIGPGSAGGNTVLSIDNTRSSTFTLAVSVTGVQSVPIVFIYYAVLSSSGPDTVSVTFSKTAQRQNMYVFEVSGVLTPPAGTSTGKNLVNIPTASMSTSMSVNFQAGAFLLGVLGTNNNGHVSAGSGFQLSADKSSSALAQGAEFATSGVSSPANFPMSANVVTNWAEAGMAFNPVQPIPEYPLGLLLLVSLMVISYAVIKRETK